MIPAIFGVADAVATDEAGKPREVFISTSKLRWVRHGRACPGDPRRDNARIFEFSLLDAVLFSKKPEMSRRGWP
jgi:hypothetical protein